MSLYACVKRVLEQWDTLKLYFQGEYLIDNHAKNIHIKLINPIYNFYLKFLEFVLPIFTNLNLEFQSQKPKIHQIYNKMSAAYRTLLDCYIKPDYLKKHDISEIQYRNPIHYLPNDQIYLGGKYMTDLSNNIIKNNEKDVCINNCLHFYIEGAHQFYKRFPFNSSYIKSLKALSFLDPNNISNIVSIAPAATHFELILNMDLNDLDREWRLLKNSVEDYNNETIAFWKTVKDMKKGDDSELFPLLNKFIKLILTLPHSSAATERVFSTINLNKTKTRNRLETETLSRMLNSKNILNFQKKSCYNFEINEEMIK